MVPEAGTGNSRNTLIFMMKIESKRMYLAVYLKKG
jgi:hypothetical protein